MRAHDRSDGRAWERWEVSRRRGARAVSRRRIERFKVELIEDLSDRRRQTITLYRRANSPTCVAARTCSRRQPDEGDQAELERRRRLLARRCEARELTRIYGTAFFSKEDLEQHLENSSAPAERPPSAGHQARPVQLHEISPGRRSGMPDGHPCCNAIDRDVARAACRARLPGGADANPRTARSSGKAPGTGTTYQETHVPHCADDGGHQLRHEADELSRRTPRSSSRERLSYRDLPRAHERAGARPPLRARAACCTA